MAFFGLLGSRPPAADLAARRMFLLRVLVASAQEELTRLNSGAARTGGLAVGTQRTLERLGVWRIATAGERTIVQRLDTGWAEQELVDALWRAEAVVCLLWALGLIQELPPYDAPAEADLLERVPPPAEFDAFRDQAVLRPKLELERARSTAALWHWRARTRQLADSGAPLPPGLPAGGLDGVIRLTAQAAQEHGTLATADGDFLALGRPYRELTVEEYELAHSVARERHHALNWICGRASRNRWDRTPTGT